MRSRQVYGPYERRVVLARGKTPVNGPHQGAWVDTPAGESWFLHFQDKDAYGRILHLQPMKWVDDWPIIGDNGEPVLSHKKPVVARASPVVTPVESEEFNDSTLGLQWQWQANPKSGWAFPAPAMGVLRLYAMPTPDAARNLWDVPNLLLQKFPAPEFMATAKVTFHALAETDKTGLVVMGSDYAYVSVKRKGDALVVSQTICKRADAGGAERESASQAVTNPDLYFRVRVTGDAMCEFSYGVDGAAFTVIGEPFQAKKGRWIGAKAGLFAVRSGAAAEHGYADYDWFRVEKAARKARAVATYLRSSASRIILLKAADVKGFFKNNKPGSSENCFIASCSSKPLEMMIFMSGRMRRM